MTNREYAAANNKPHATPATLVTNASASNNRRTLSGRKPTATSNPTCRGRCSIASRNRSATRIAAATIRKKLNPMNSPPKSFEPPADLSPSARISRNVSPSCSGCTKSRMPFASRSRASVAAIPSGIATRTEVKAP